MIYVHSLGRAARYFPERTAFVANGKRSTFRELHARVERIAAALTNMVSKPEIDSPFFFQTSLITSSSFMRAPGWASSRFR